MQEHAEPVSGLQAARLRGRQQRRHQRDIDEIGDDGRLGQARDGDIERGLAVSLEQAINEQREYPAVKAMAASQDYIEGPKAFAEKRPPKWVGK